MGSLRRFDLEELTRRSGAACLVETGTGLGRSLSTACRAFSMSHSCEVVPLLRFLAGVRLFFKRSKVRLYGANSVDFLSEVLPRIAKDAPVVFWLDAHFPGADFSLGSYDESLPEHIRLPLTAELRVIREHRDTRRDVLILDDLRLYEEGPFANGPVPAEIRGVDGLKGRLDEAIRPFLSTHSACRCYLDEGYLILAPAGLGLSPDAAEIIQPTGPAR